MRYLDLNLGDHRKGGVAKIHRAAGRVWRSWCDRIERRLVHGFGHATDGTPPSKSSGCFFRVQAKSGHKVKRLIDFSPKGPQDFAERKQGFSVEQVPVSASGGSSKNLKDLKDLALAPRGLVALAQTVEHDPQHLV